MAGDKDNHVKLKTVRATQHGWLWENCEGYTAVQTVTVFQ